jgi:1-pyrroline-5-carboxylate dehydrogenase
MWNYNEFRPLEGFVFALTPFNFTSIAGNLPAAPAMLGNVAVWKPSKTAVYSAAVIMEIFREAACRWRNQPGICRRAHYFAGGIEFSLFCGIHFTGSTAVFQSIWKTIGENIYKYKSYPRIVGETGGKDFVFADAPPILRRWPLPCCAVLLNTRAKNVRLPPGRTSRPVFGKRSASVWAKNWPR